MKMTRSSRVAAAAALALAPALGSPPEARFRAGVVPEPRSAYSYPHLVDTGAILRHITQVVAVTLSATLALLAVVLVGLGAPRAAAAADLLPETMIGDPQAPVTIIEFSSLTCPHCAAFHRETLPKIEETYIDTGKARLIYRDFPLGRLALAAAVVGRCVDPARHFGFVGMLYRDQADWAQSADPLAELKIRAQLAGLSETDFNACLENKPLIQAIQQRAQEGQQEYGIDSTPSFIIDGQKLAGEQSFETFSAAIDAALAKAR